MLNILPAAVAEQLKRNPGEVIAVSHAAVSVLFADLVDFTRWSAARDPVDVVRLLDTLFSKFDAIAMELGIEKIKTIGDEYMAAAGLPEPQARHAELAAEAALRMQATTAGFKGLDGQPMCLRIGIASGPVG